jgi:uncharacterized protein with von Willebrand factor type A (vWA) domain
MRRPEEPVVAAAVTLGRTLREAGVMCSVDEEMVLVRALAEVDISCRAHVYWAARASLVHGPDDVPAFDALFERFWAGRELLAEGAVVEHGESDPRMPGPVAGGASFPQFRRDARHGEAVPGQPQRAVEEIPTAPGEREGQGQRQGVLAAYSPDEALTAARELRYAEDELAAVRRLAELLRRSAPERRSRRRRAARRPGRLDVRTTLRRSLATDGEPVRLVYADCSRKPRRLVFLCDVSGSMERYARELLAALGAVVGAGIRAEAFVFATRLTRLTGALASRDLDRALGEARRSVADWSGGTRIGEALARFNRVYAPLGLARGAVVVIASDGWDRGDPELLTAELARLRLQCRRLVWLNPRPNRLDGQPLAVGMRAALPLVDDFIGGGDARAVARLVGVIGGLDAARPARRQRPVRSQVP